MASDNLDRLTAWSSQLAEAHDLLRRQLRQLREDLENPLAVKPHLVTHCLSMCNEFTAHHLAEDQGLFVELLQARPDLELVVDNLVEDHSLIAAILLRIRELAERAISASSEDHVLIRAEVDGLAAIAESHFGYEERRLSQALNQGLN